MGSEQTMQVLPLIEFSRLKQQTPTWESVKIQVLEALQQYGCFEAKLDEEIPPLHLRKSFYEAMQQLFDLPLETKIRNTSDNHRGYIGQHPLVPIYQSMGIEDALSPGIIDTFAHLLWPQGNPTFSKTVQSFAEELHELEKTVRRMVLESLGLEKYEEEHMDSTTYVLRLTKYDGTGSCETKLGLPSHTDDGIITILYQVNEVRGLQVQTKDGSWITYKPSPNSFIVMVGECFRAWTNGRLQCPVHRVMMSGDKDRYSVGLYSLPKPGYIIKAPEEMVDEEHPLLFKPFDHHKFIDFKYSRTPTPDLLKDYCGI
ncbi:hypothetical protein ACS0TY_035853 [Phlomoides rotata]